MLKNYQTIKRNKQWPGQGNRTGPGASDEGQFVDAAFYNAKAYNYLTPAYFTLTYRFPKCQLEPPVHSTSPSSGEPSPFRAHSHDDGSASALSA